MARRRRMQGKKGSNSFYSLIVQAPFFGRVPPELKWCLREERKLGNVRSDKNGRCIGGRRKGRTRRFQGRLAVAQGHRDARFGVGQRLKVG
jgi:hypothetical protein